MRFLFILGLLASVQAAHHEQSTLDTAAVSDLFGGGHSHSHDGNAVPELPRQVPQRPPLRPPVQPLPPPPRPPVQTLPTPPRSPVQTLPTPPPVREMLPPPMPDRPLPRPPMGTPRNLQRPMMPLPMVRPPPPQFEPDDDDLILDSIRKTTSPKMKDEMEMMQRPEMVPMVEQKQLPSVPRPMDESFFCDKVYPKAIIRYGGRQFFFSWLMRNKDSQKGWEEAGSYCRSRCMTLITIIDPKIGRFLGGAAKQDDIYGFWTGGTIAGNGWIWAGTGRLVNPDLFSRGGRLGKPQPDNFLGISSGGLESERCLSVLNNWYGDGEMGLHDFSCFDKLPFVCEFA